MIDFLLEEGRERGRYADAPAVESESRAGWLWHEGRKLSMSQ
jgi:hypothetical protein